MRPSSILMLTIVVFLWGSSFVVIKLGLEEMPPTAIAFLRFLLVLPIFAIIAYTRHRAIFTTAILRDWKTFVSLGLMGVTLGHVLQNVGLKFTTASNSSLIIASNPIFIALLASMYLKERLSTKQVSGMALAFFGMSVVIMHREGFRFGSNPMGLIGDLLSLGAGISWASYTVFGKDALSRYDALMTTTSSMVYGTIFLFPIALVIEPAWGLPTSIRAWAFLLFLSYLSVGLGYLFWFKALEDASASETGVFLFFIPIVSMSTAYLILGEPVGILLALGAVMVLLGTVIVERG
ncbi:MAG: DMT family transporter [Candidatus Bathyarchaeia archaeon]